VIDLYRVVTAEEAKEARAHGIAQVRSSENGEWGGEPRIYFWTGRRSAEAYRRFLVSRRELQEKKRIKFSILHVRVPDSDVVPDEDPTSVVRDFGPTCWVKRYVTASEVV